MNDRFSTRPPGDPHQLTGERGMIRSRSRLGGLRWVVVLLLAAAPTTPVLYRAWALSRPGRSRGRVLAKMATQPTVLVNITAREMPASPDVLHLGRRATRALEHCVADNVHAAVRARCAYFLGLVGARRSLPALQAALADWEGRVRRAVIRALREIPDKSSVKSLLGLYNRGDESVSNKRAVLTTLGQLSSTKAVAFLRREARRVPAKDKPDFRTAAFSALWESRHLMARRTLVNDVIAALSSKRPGLVQVATRASAELRSARLVRALIPLMEHPWAEVRNKAVYALGRIGDRSATRALLQRLPRVREARMLNNIAFALERLDREQFFAAVRKLTRHKQAVIRLNAAFVVGDVRRPEGLPLLRRALADGSDYVRASAIVAIGKLGQQSGIKDLRRFVGDKNPSLRAEAIYAINRLSAGKNLALIYDKLFKRAVRDSRWQTFTVRRRAALELARYNDARVRPFLLRCYERYRCTLGDVRPLFLKSPARGTRGRLLLAWARGRLELTDLVARLRPTGAGALAGSVTAAARARGRKDRVGRGLQLIADLQAKAYRDLAAKVNGTTTDALLRLQSAVALARLGDEKAVTGIIAALDNFPVARLERLVAIVARIKEPAVRRRLDGELAKRAAREDAPLSLAAAAVRLRWFPERAWFTFLKALASGSVQKRALAADYIAADRSDKVTWLLRRALARESRPLVRDRLRILVESRRKRASG